MLFFDFDPPADPTAPPFFPVPLVVLFLVLLDALLFTARSRSWVLISNVELA